MRHPIILLTSIVCALSLLWSAGTSRADNLTTITSESSSQDWNSSIWQTNGTGTFKGTPVVGNTYQMIYNGIPVGNGAASTLVRTPTTSSNKAITFKGDSLTIGTNAELKLKKAATTPVNPTIVTFAGVSGNPGLIIDGGVLNSGQGTWTFNVVGSIDRKSTRLNSSHANISYALFCL